MNKDVKKILLQARHENETNWLKAIQTLLQGIEVFPEEKKFYEELGTSLLRWLRLAIEQQHRSRKIKATDATIAGWLNTHRATVIKYKNILKDLGYLSIDTSKKLQALSVNYSPGS